MINDKAHSYAVDASNSAKDAAGNIGDVAYFIETDSRSRAVQQIGWTIENSQRAIRYAKLALTALGEK